MSTSEQRRLFLNAKVRVMLAENSISVTAEQLLVSDEGHAEPFTVESPMCLIDKGSDVRLALAPGNGTARSNADPVLLRLLVHAFAARKMMLEGRAQPLVAGYSAEHLMKLFRLTCFAPDIISSILEGKQPIALTGRQLLRAPHIPHLWSEQRRLFGFA